MLRGVAVFGAATFIVSAAIVSAAIVSAAIVSAACPGAHASTDPLRAAHRTEHRRPEADRVAPRHWPAAKPPVVAASDRTPSEAAYQLAPPALDTSLGAPTSLSYQVPPSGANTTPGVLSDQENEVSRLAAAQGDREFLMVDKALGKIILFEHGKATFAGAALTGQSVSDRLPEGELTQKFDNLNALDTKVTPAGRYTVDRRFDQEYGGPLLHINEIKGKDWGIAIHKVWLGNPAEHRAERLLSPNDQDKHITFGCINVEPDTIRFLLEQLPATGSMPLYILPEDASETASYFAAHTS